MPLISVNGIDIKYQVHEPSPSAFTPRPTVVLINGLADDQETWAAQIPALTAAGYPVLAFDNRGIGSSSRPPGEYTAELLASDCKSLVDALRIPNPFHLLGVSMGGMIAQSYALMHPEDIQSLTLACTYAKPNIFCQRLFNFWADVAKGMGVPTVMREVIAWAFTQSFFEPTHQDELAQIDAAMEALDMTTEQYLSQLNVIQVFDSTKDVHNLSSLRVLVIAGEADILIPTSSSHELHKLIPGSQWKTVKGGHACLWEFPDDFNRAIVEFLDQSG